MKERPFGIVNGFWAIILHALGVQVGVAWFALKPSLESYAGCALPGLSASPMRCSCSYVQVGSFQNWHLFPEGQGTQHLRSLLPKTIPLMVVETRVLIYWVLGPPGFTSFQHLLAVLWKQYRTNHAQSPRVYMALTIWVLGGESLSKRSL